MNWQGLLGGIYPCPGRRLPRLIAFDARQQFFFQPRPALLETPHLWLKLIEEISHLAIFVTKPVEACVRRYQPAHLRPFHWPKPNGRRLSSRYNLAGVMEGTDMSCPDKNERSRYWENVAADTLLTLYIAVPIATLVLAILRL